MSDKVKVVVTNHPLYDGIAPFFGWIIVFCMIFAVIASKQYFVMLGLIIWFCLSAFLKFKKNIRFTDSFFIPFGFGFALVALIQAIW